MTNYEIFCKTVELGSLSRTAEVLSYSQSNITHVIQQMEKSFGFTLLIRNKAGVSLTENGKIVYEKIKQVLAAENELLKTVQEINGFSLGSLRIGVFSSIAAELLPKALKKYSEQYPRVEITLYDGDHEAVLGWLMDGTIDIGFLSQIPPKKGIEFLPLLQDEMLALMPEKHRARDRMEIPVSFFAEEPTIYPYETIAHDVDAVMKASNVKPSISLEVKGSETIVAMVREGLGVSILPELYMRSHGEGIVTRPLSPRFYRTIGAALPENSANKALTERFLEIVREVI